jgi:hypothetical protein
VTLYFFIDVAAIAEFTASGMSAFTELEVASCV